MIVDIDNVILTPDVELSTWNAVRNPIVYKMQRQDFIFDQVNDASGDLQLQFTGVNVASSFTVGDTIYIKSDNGVYDLFVEVTASAFSTNTLVTVDAAYVSAAPGGFTNNDDLRPVYRVSVEVYNADDEQIGNTQEYSPTSKGALLIDVSEIIKPYLNPEIPAFDDNLQIDSNIFVGFYIVFTEVWVDSAESEVDDSDNVFYAILGARQIPSANGGNMVEYVTFEDATPLAKFLTKATTHKIWSGFPYLISAIIGDDVADDVLKVND